MDFSKYFPLINKKNPPVDDQPLVDAYNQQVDPDIQDSAALLGIEQNPVIPFAPQAPVEREPAAQIPAPAPQAPVAAPEFKAADLASNLKDSYGPDGAQAATPEAPASPDFDSLLKAAQDTKNNNMFINNLLKAGQTVGSALTRTGEKPDYSVANSLNEQAGQGVENVIQQMKSKKDSIGLGDEKKLRDPASDVSKAFRATLAKLGIPYTEKTTAWDAKALGINPQNLLMQDRALEKQMKLLDIKQGKDRDAFLTGAQKTLLKPYQQYQKVATAKQSLDGYLKGEPSGPKDVAILYDFIKGLDPESAVKEGEIQLGKSAMSLMEQYGITAKKLTRSDILSPKFRSVIGDIMKSKEQQARENYEEIRQPFLLHGASKGLTEEDYGKLDYLSAADAKKAAEGIKKDPASVVPQSGGMVKVTRISDGASKMMTAEQAAKADKTKYRVE